MPMALDVHVEENYDGKAQYFREYVADYLKDWIKDNDYDLYSSGLKIYTTIDTRMQKYAEDAAENKCVKFNKILINIGVDRIHGETKMVT